MIKFNVGVKAIIEHEGKVLLLRKNDFWDTPGGRIDDNETTEDTLRRELAEELPGITNVRVGKLLHVLRLPGMTFGEYGLFLVWYHVVADFPDDVQLSDEHQEYRWCIREEVAELASPGISEAVESL